MVKEKIIAHIICALQAMSVDARLITPLQLDIPTDVSHGDYSTNIAFQLSKALKKAPMLIAQEISAKLNEKPIDEVEKIEAVKPGFINFTLSKKELIRNLDKLLKDERKVYESVKTKEPKIIIVEYSSPNIAKPFTIGHLRSTIIGDAIANLLEAIGHDVKRDNHVGDWGTQFGKQIFALKHIDAETGFASKDLNDESTLKKNIQFIERSSNPVKELVNLYIRFHLVAEDKDNAAYNPAYEDLARAEFKALESGNSQSRELWQKCIDWSWKEFDAIYKELGVHFTENTGKGFGESFFENRMIYVLHELEEKKLLTEGKEGAKIVEFPDETKLPPLMILKKDGATLYATRDLATDKFRLEEYGKHITIINEVGAEQSLYFKQLYTLEEKLGWFKKGQRIHIKHGMYRFKDGKMSTRKGNVIWLEDVISEAKNRVDELMGERDIKKKISPDTFLPLIEMVAIGAIKWNDLKRSSHLDIAFDWDDILNMQGNSGPYIQYTYARSQSILRKAGQKTGVKNDKLVYIKEHYEIEEYRLLRQIYQFSETVQKAAETYSPNIICEYLFTLAQEFNTFYQKYRILDASEDSEKVFRLALTTAIGEVIKYGLKLLGIAAPSEM